MALNTEHKQALNKIRFPRYLGPLLGDLIDLAIQTDPISVLSGAVDPSAGAGVVANPGDLYRRDAPGADGGELWVKSGDADTAWVLVNTSAPAVGDNLGNHTATQDINMAGNGFTSTSTIDFTSTIADGGTAFLIDHPEAFTVIGSKLLLLTNNFLEIMSVEKSAPSWGSPGGGFGINISAGSVGGRIQSAGGTATFNFTTLAPDTAQGGAMFAEEDWDGFTGHVAYNWVSPNASTFDSFYPNAGGGSIGSRLWNWDDFSNAEHELYRVSSTDYRVRSMVVDGAAKQNIIEIQTSDHNDMGIADAHFTVVTDDIKVIMAGASGVGLRNLVKINGTQVLSTQGAAVADATDAASAITQLNLLLARCRAHGLIA